MEPIKEHYSTSDYVKMIQAKIPYTSRLEQMAEECCELAQALLKKSRKLRGENYTPKSIEEVCDAVNEEFTDVILCARTLGMSESPGLMHEKAKRWHSRNQ